MTLEDGLITKGGGQMGFAHPCGTDQNKVGGLLQPLGVQKLHDLIFGDLRIKSPVELTESFDAFNPRHPHQVFNPFLFPEARFLSEKGEQKGSFLLGEGLRIREKAKEFP